ncbi:MAG: ATPase, T2SS/T4P/T4SS family [Candidatus Paceibacterota bacterium]
MENNQEKIKEILLGSGYISPEDMQKAEEFSKKNRSSLIDYFLSEGLISKDLLGQAYSEFVKVDYADLNSNHPAKELVLEIPEEIAKKYRILIFKKNAKKIILTTDNPENENLKKALEEDPLKEIFKGKKIEIAYSLPEDIDSAFLYYRKALATRFADILSKKKLATSEIINEIIEDAILYRASDIHFEPQEKDVLIRFRIDGVLNEAGSSPKDYYENILNRIKVLANIRIDEHFAAQDGAIRYVLNNKNIDLRVSIIPTINGEKVVLRVLSVYVQSFSLSEIGLSDQDKTLLEEASQKPFGMILVAGPTGSGKSTTLYSVLKTLNSLEDNITTIEDPVEYKISGVNQVQVNTRTGLTFSKGLRSIVRQDPDVILVGEIRDKETAEIAVNAALTGHLLLSTFHANDAATALPRLLDMGVEPFLLASTLELLIAQRLSRKICENCRYGQDYELKEIEKIFPDAKKYFSEKTVTLYKGKGCPACNNTGYKGRTAIFELIKVTPDLKDLILKNPSTNQIWKLAYKNGSRSLFDDGIEKVKNGIITLEELLRVVKPLDLE